MCNKYEQNFTNTGTKRTFEQEFIRNYLLNYSFLQTLLIQNLQPDGGQTQNRKHLAMH